MSYMSGTFTAYLPDKVTIRKEVSIASTEVVVDCIIEKLRALSNGSLMSLGDSHAHLVT